MEQTFIRLRTTERRSYEPRNLSQILRHLRASDRNRFRWIAVKAIRGPGKQATSTDPVNVSTRPASTAPGSSRPSLSAAAPMP